MQVVVAVVVILVLVVLVEQVAVAVEVLSTLQLRRVMERLVQRGVLTREEIETGKPARYFGTPAVFKAPIADEDMPAIVDYLVKTYGNEQGQ